MAFPIPSGDIILIPQSDLHFAGCKLLLRNGSVRRFLLHAGFKDNRLGRHFCRSALCASRTLQFR